MSGRPLNNRSRPQGGEVRTLAPQAALSTRLRGLIFASLVTLCAVSAVAYVTSAALRDQPSSGGPLTGQVEAGGNVSDVAMVANESGSLLFQHLAPDNYWRQVGAVEFGGAEGTRTMVPLKCDRIHYAADRGLCLTELPRVRYAAYVFGPHFQPQHKIDLLGLPSRTRVSPDGRFGAITIFVSGHSYAAARFSTETTLIDLMTGEKLANLEDFTIFRDGAKFQSVDFNFWGVTFKPDSNQFYATLSSGGETYLIEGRIDAREATVLRSNVECPSLSPDGTRIAFKKRGGGGLGRITWRFHTYNLATKSETALAEPRSIDDQLEWLDNDRVLYGDGTDIWILPADGTGAPKRFLSEAGSPAVVRTAKPMTSDGRSAVGFGGSGNTPLHPPAGDTFANPVRKDGSLS